MSAAPDFSDEAEQPALPVILDEAEQRFIAAAGGDFSGVRVEQDRELVSAVLGAFAGGVSQRRIASAFGLSRNTVAGMVARATESGRIEPYKQRMSGKLARAIEAGIEQWTDAVEAGQVSASQIPVAVGIFSDKKALLDGEATSRIERSDGPTVADVIERMRRAKGVIEIGAGSAVDSE